MHLLWLELCAFRSFRARAGSSCGPLHTEYIGTAQEVNVPVVATSMAGSVRHHGASHGYPLHGPKRGCEDEPCRRHTVTHSEPPIANVSDKRLP